MREALIGILSDTHFGSRCAAWPEADNRWAGSLYVTRCLRHCAKTFPKVKLLILLGDMIHGKNPKEQGIGCYTTKLSEQVQFGAIKMLEPFVEKADAVMRVWGTGYHEPGDDPMTAFDEHFKDKLKAEHVKDVLDIPIGKDRRIFNAAHHPASGSTLYMGTAVDKEALWSLVAAGIGKVKNPRWIIRGHKHTYIQQDQEGKTVCLSPGWMLPDWHCKRTNYWRFQSSVGAMLFAKDEYMKGEYRFVPMIYPAPVPDVCELGRSLS